MASDLGEEMDTETEISGDIRNLLPREVKPQADHPMCSRFKRIYEGYE